MSEEVRESSQTANDVLFSTDFPSRDAAVEVSKTLNAGGQWDKPLIPVVVGVWDVGRRPLNHQTGLPIDLNTEVGGIPGGLPGHAVLDYGLLVDEGKAYDIAKNSDTTFRLLICGRVRFAAKPVPAASSTEEPTSEDEAPIAAESNGG